MARQYPATMDPAELRMTYLYRGLRFFSWTANLRRTWLCTAAPETVVSGSTRDHRTSWIVVLGCALPHPPLNAEMGSVFSAGPCGYLLGLLSTVPHRRWRGVFDLLSRNGLLQRKLRLGGMRPVEWDTPGTKAASVSARRDYLFLLRPGILTAALSACRLAT